ncbi:DUF4251 domain-containing protein [Chryseobacterium chendengshani]|uniref:DUF4251 domain-containing protein n=1 Tax=unclassified Chryseobacterium TaxID=2593645 RepID=UPI001C644602|nr:MULTISPECIES: DUF4251 domain-containing protein [unclassified Chryseobacterium]MBW7675144.1 DUF4251 domain-containing protein [Chryseobacterium sp. LJ756]MBW8522307.1 DUF4251 domain-containing protein [Chryseobacterium sp. LJ668]QYK17946.1 DUF4251 domain-containing protein [Chryseobacterium sp. LJ668]
MKKYLTILSIFTLILSLQSCSAQNTADSQIVNSLVSSEEFTFHAERANPMNYDVINALGSMPNNPSTRILQLDAGSYSIELKKEKMEVVLPYFGRAFNSTYGRSDNSYRFTSKDYTVTKSQSKKGNWIFKIKPNDVNNVSDINIEVYKNGKAFTSIRSNDRQPITYDGYISKNEEIKPTNSK